MIALHNNITSHRQGRDIKNDNENSPIPSPKGTEGDTISVGCQTENHTEGMTADLHLLLHYAGGEELIHTCPFKNDCWYTFTIPQPTLTMCLWADPNSHFSLDFQFTTDVNRLSLLSNCLLTFTVLVST